MNTVKNTPISLLICALGGEGGGVLSEWLVDVARHAGYAAQATSIPGVAQRTGATTYYIEVFPTPQAELSRQPIFSLNPVPGKLDMMISSELLETARQVTNGLPAKEVTQIITSSSRALTTGERMVLGDGRMDSDKLLQLIEASAARLNVLDMNAIAKECGTIVSAVMLGAIAGSGLFPFALADYKAVVGSGSAIADKSWRGFERAFDIVSKQIKTKQMLAEMLADDETSQVQASQTSQGIAISIQALGTARMVEYQGESYAKLYIERLAAVSAATSDALVTQETARWLALWMAFDDIVRVADLKSRAQRWARVKGEVKLGDADLLQVYDHFKPGVPEFAAMLPPGLAQRVTQWDRARINRGKDPWALPLKIGTHSVLGMLALRTLASLKWLRPFGSRFQTEQALIDQWLASVVTTTRADWQTGFELAQCGRLIKGYGSTNERGKDNLLHIIEHLATSQNFTSSDERALAIAAARKAALADDAGQALDRTLVQHGVAARPVKAQPIRWVKNPHMSKPR